QAHGEVVKIFSQALTGLFQLSEQANVLVVGLGNWNATPDALGPRVVKHTLVTRHLYQYAPEELHGGMRSVSALAPGVLGITGIETAEIIRGVVDSIKPELIIAVDALAAG
ncbi:MAG: GPR endopeptidase, partial [Candidatus Desulforudaceae bacterium]